mgnify:CR=1 FL=1
MKLYIILSLVLLWFYLNSISVGMSGFFDDDDEE